MSHYKIVIIKVMLTCIAIVAGWFVTHINMLPIPSSLTRHIMETEPLPILLDRDGVPLNRTYSTKWNQSDQIALHKVPVMVQKIFILSEDRHFYDHMGIDWSARLHALIQNISAGRAVRGASTITEQVIRMIHPRKRTIWSRWIEGFEARELEKISSKPEILEFYLNQVPYGSNRRGVVQAARFYFDRTLETLNDKEVLALATLVRAPSAYDLYGHPDKITKPLERLATRAIRAELLTASRWNQIKERPFHFKDSELDVEAPHFVNHVYSNLSPLSLRGKTHIRTTLKSTLQNRVQNILTTTLKNLKMGNVANGSVLIAERGTGSILAWAVSSNSMSQPYTKENKSGNQTVKVKDRNILSTTQYIDAVKALRQPGSAMKPFLYALALEKGWSAATLIDDSPLKEPVGVGIHTYHNYSHIHYGEVTLRNALGNSLNIPAIKAIRFTGVDTYLERLREAGITTLTRHPDFYGDGLALGNGEISLYEMVQAYNVLANSGQFIPLSPFYDSQLQQALNSKHFSSEPDSLYTDPLSGSHHTSRPLPTKIVFSKEVASIIGNILSDPGARELEFGGGDLLNFPVQTAVKTGTSSDYRDGWAMGYNSHYTAGVWMGNLDGSPTVELTGSKGPAFVLRSIFAELNHMGKTGKTSDCNQPLYMSPKLIKKEICLTSINDGQCVTKTEWFIPGTETDSPVKEDNRVIHFSEKNGVIADPNNYKVQSRVYQDSKKPLHRFGFVNPLNGLEVAMDPRIPDELEYMEFKVAEVLPEERVKWVINGEIQNQEGFHSEVIRSYSPDSNHLESKDGDLNSTQGNDTLQWKVQRGYQRVYTELIDKSGRVRASKSVTFLVK